MQPGQNLLYGNQIRLNSPASKQSFFSPDGTDRRADRSLCRIFWCSRVASRPLPLLLGDTESKGCKSTHFLPPLPSPPLVSLPHLQTQIAAGQSQAFLYAEPVTGVTHHSPRVPSLTSCKARPRSAACMELCDWFATVITIRGTVAPAASSLFRARRSPPPPPPSPSSPSRRLPLPSHAHLSE